MGKHQTEAKRQEVLNYLIQGMTPTQAARAGGVTTMTVRKWAVRFAGYTVKRRPVSAQKEKDLKEFTEAWESSANVAEAAAKLHMTIASTRSKAANYRYAGIPLKKFPRGNSTPGRHDLILEYHGQGKSIAQIAKLIGISNESVCYHLKKAGISPQAEREKINQARRAIVLNYGRMGYGATKIANLTHIHRNVIMKWLVEAGVHTPKPVKPNRKQPYQQLPTEQDEITIQREVFTQAWEVFKSVHGVAQETGIALHIVMARATMYGLAEYKNSEIIRARRAARVL